MLKLLLFPAIFILILLIISIRFSIIKRNSNYLYGTPLKSDINICQKICDCNSYSQNKNTIGIKPVLISVILSFLIAYNIYCIVTFPIIRSFHYKSSDNGFTEIECPAKGRDLDIVLANFEKYTKGINNQDIKLYIISTRTWDNIFLWYDNFTNPRWRMPYKSE